MVRCFEDDDVIHVAGRVDPSDDADTIDTELLLSDMDTAAKAVQRIAKNAKSGNKDAVAEKAFLERVQAILEERDPRAPDRGPADRERPWLHQLHLLTAKPVMYIANVDEGGFEDNPMLDALVATRRRRRAQVVAVCAAIEAEIVQLEDAEKAEFLAEMDLEEPGLDRVIRAGYALLGLQTFFTAGEKEVRAWTVRAGATAPQGAGRIHTDFEKGFIRAEVVGYDDFVALRRRERREGGRQVAARGQGVRDARRGRRALPLQRLTRREGLRRARAAGARNPSGSRSAPAPGAPRCAGCWSWPCR